MLIAVVVLAHLIGFVSSIDAVWNTRTSQGAIAWAVVLNTFPYVGVPAYWVLGRSRFKGYVTARQDEDNEIKHVARNAGVLAAPYFVPESEARYVEATRAAVRLAKIPFLRGNETELLIDGEATFGSILDGIDRAQDYILFQFFIVKHDELGTQVKDHLVAKAREGVRVHILYDEVGSHDLSKEYKEELRAAGAELSDFHSRKGSGNRFQINFRNHRKIVVVDGEEAWIGGHNVGDEYMGRDPKFGNWRDTHVRIQGPAALAAQVSFLEDWYWATEQIPELDWTPKPAADPGGRVLIIPTGPADELETAALMFIHAINSARERLWIASPYFVPDEGVIPGRGRAHPHSGHARPPARLSRGILLLRRGEADRGEVLPVHGRLSAPEGHAGRRRVRVGRHGELRQPLVPAEFRNHGHHRGFRFRLRRGADVRGRFRPFAADGAGRAGQEVVLVQAGREDRAAHVADSVEG
jgi:cardiolipin synthase